MIVVIVMCSIHIYNAYPMSFIIFLFRTSCFVNVILLTFGLYLHLCAVMLHIFAFVVRSCLKSFHIQHAYIYLHIVRCVSPSPSLSVGDPLSDRSLSTVCIGDPCSPRVPRTIAGRYRPLTVGWPQGGVPSLAVGCARSIEN